jgi:hypothetical protein
MTKTIEELEAAWVEALDAAHQYTLTQYGMGFLKHPVDRERILAALTQNPVADSQPADPVVNVCAAIREAALREAAIKIQEQVNDLKDQNRKLALNLAVYGRDVVLALIGEKK